MKIFVILAVVALVLAVEGGKHRGKGKRRNGHKKSKSKTCEQITRECESRSSASGDSKGQVCASKDGTYTTYDKTCSFKKAVICDGVKQVHNGKCGECTEANLCPIDPRLARMKEKLEGETREEKKQSLEIAIKKLEEICTVSGSKMTMCEFNTATCNAAAKGEALPVKKIACVCDEETACPYLGKMKEKVKTLSGRKKAYKEKEIARKQCYCDYKVKACQAQEDGTPPPSIPDCRKPTAA